MREPRDHRYEGKVLLEALRAYHFKGETQRAIAERLGISVNYLSRVMHGKSRPELYDQIAAEERKRGKKSGKRKAKKKKEPAAAE